MNNSIPFYKYHGAGNDFVMIDNRLPAPFDVKNPELIARLCHRNFGIGGDGLILLENDNESDFIMRYFNADGREGSMCGNGGRCIVAFANDLGIIDSEGSFSATDGIHFFKVLDNDHFAISLIDVTKIECKQNGYYIDTGSPHWVEFVPDLDGFDVYNEGKKIRLDPAFGEGGTNVNFLVDSENGLEVATFERGVEGETLACGTGVTASAMAYYLSKGWQVDKFEVSIRAKGGILHVSFKPNHDNDIPTFSDVWLTGPALQVFKGEFFL
jgi:diaminopimelate epimerase